MVSENGCPSRRQPSACPNRFRHEVDHCLDGILEHAAYDLGNLFAGQLRRAWIDGSKTILVVSHRILIFIHEAKLWIAERGQIAMVPHLSGEPND